MVSTKAQLLCLETTNQKLGEKRGILRPSWAFVETNIFAVYCFTEYKSTVDGLTDHFIDIQYLTVETCLLLCCHVYGVTVQCTDCDRAEYVQYYTGLVRIQQPER